MAEHGRRARAVIDFGCGPLDLGEVVHSFLLGASFGTVSEEESEREKGKKGKVGVVGKRPTRTNLYFPAEPAGRRSLTPWGQLGKRRPKLKGQKSVGATELERCVLCTAWQFADGFVGS